MTSVLNEKLSDAMRKELRALGTNGTIRVIVTLQYADSKPIARRATRAERRRALAASDKKMEETLTRWIHPVLRDYGGKLVNVSPQLCTITVQGHPPLIEQLSKVDAVTAILENQPVHAIR